MNRQIKFRGKCKNTNQWFTGYLIVTNIGPAITSYDWIDLKTVSKKEIYSGQLNCVIVDPETVGQFTGLRDKGGNEIYEGDIVEHEFYNHNQNATKIIQEVYFDNGCFNLKTVGKKAFPVEQDRNNVPLFWCLPPNKISVIGNIHENPELLQP